MKPFFSQADTGDERAIAVLIDMLADKDQHVRSAAVESLSEASDHFEKKNGCHFQDQPDPDKTSFNLISLVDLVEASFGSFESQCAGKSSLLPQIVFKDDRSVHQTLSVCLEETRSAGDHLEISWRSLGFCFFFGSPFDSPFDSPASLLPFRTPMLCSVKPHLVELQRYFSLRCGSHLPGGPSPGTSGRTWR